MSSSKSNPTSYLTQIYYSALTTPQIWQQRTTRYKIDTNPHRAPSLIPSKLPSTDAVCGVRRNCEPKTTRKSIVLCKSERRDAARHDDFINAPCFWYCCSRRCLLFYHTECFFFGCDKLIQILFHFRDLKKM